MNVINLKNNKLNMRAEGERKFGVNRYIDIIPPPRTQPFKVQIQKKENFFYASLTRFAVLLLAVGLNATGLFFTAENVLAYFNDDEKSTDNLIIAGAIDFILIDGEWVPMGSNLTLEAGDSTSRTVTVSDTAPSFSNPFNYTVHIEKTSGDDDFCDLILLDASMEGAPDYSGSLLGFLSGQYVFDPSGTDEWEFVVSVPSEAEGIDGKECNFDFVYDGWQLNQPNYPDGFHDTERTASVVIGYEAPMCESLSIGYWRNHEGCTTGGGGSSIWAPDVNDLSLQFEGVFSSYSGGDICSNLWVPNCPSGNSFESKLCKAKAHTLADELNVVSEHLNLDALIAGADDGSSAFDILGLTSGSTVGQGLAAIELILANTSSTIAQVTDADYVAERLYVFYEDENPDAPMCVMPKGSIVINEFLPNPIGSDNAPMPDGEWVELYNLSGTDIDVEGWYLYDSMDTHPLIISPSNSDNDGDTSDAGETTVHAGGYLVTYLGGAYSPGWLNNSGDMVRLYNGPAATSTLVDWYEYTSDAPENKSFARILDGTGDFVDPIPTPLKPNKLTEEDPIADLTANSTSSVGEGAITADNYIPEDHDGDVTDINTSDTRTSTEDVSSEANVTTTEDGYSSSESSDPIENSSSTESDGSTPPSTIIEESSSTTTDDLGLIPEPEDEHATSTDSSNAESGPDTDDNARLGEDDVDNENESGSEIEDIENYSKDSKPEGIDDVSGETEDNDNGEGNGNENDDTATDSVDAENDNSNSNVETSQTEVVPSDADELDGAENTDITSGTSESAATKNEENETVNNQESGENSENLN